MLRITTLTCSLLHKSVVDFVNLSIMGTYHNELG